MDGNLAFHACMYAQYVSSNYSGVHTAAASVTKATKFKMQPLATDVFVFVNAWVQVRQKIKEFALWSVFEGFIMTCILANTLTLAMNKFPMTVELNDQVRYEDANMAK